MSTKAVVRSKSNPRRGTQAIPTRRATPRYLALVKQFPLRVIASEAEFDTAIEMTRALMDRGSLAQDEQDYLCALAILVEVYEDSHYPIPDVSAAAMLRHLIEAKSVTQAEVSRATGLAESTLSEILRGKRQLGRKHMEALAPYFHVKPAVFLKA